MFYGGTFIDSTDNLKIYEKVKDNLKFISSSTVRTKIIISLTRGTTTLKDLKEQLGVDSSTILHAMKKLVNKNLVYKEGDEYFISQTGIVIGLKLIDMIKMLFIFNHKEDLIFGSELPVDLIWELNELNFSDFILPENSDFIFYHHFHNYIMKSKNLRGVSSICNTNILETFRLIAENDKQLEVIVTPQVIRETRDVLDSDILDLCLNLISDEKIKIWTIERDLSLSFFITDDLIFLGLLTNHGDDVDLKDMISYNSNAVDWGNCLFDYYLKDAQRLKLN